jgi:hypothetical protein
MTELDIRIAEIREKIAEIRSNTTDENLEEMSVAQHELELELDELLKQKEIVSHLRY